jgi:hypothetical protein
METKLFLDMSPQPDQTTCGPTCLHAVYRYYDDPMSLSQVIAEVPNIKGGGTLGVYLGCHALRRRYRAVIYTYNLQVFDPTWFGRENHQLSERLRLQLEYKRGNSILETATSAYLEFLELGGMVKYSVLTGGLIRKFLKRGIPILTGLSATYLYDCPREVSKDAELIYDDIRGESTGHFVILSGYDRVKRQVLVADPLLPNPVSPSHYYPVPVDQLVCAILIGILTYDGNLLIIEPKKKPTNRQGA